MLTKEQIDGDAPYTEMGPTLLAAMRTEIGTKDRYELEEDWPVIFQHCESTVRSAYFWRFSWWAHWARLAELWKPRRYHFLITPNKMNRGSPVNDSILDSTALSALNTCAAGMWSGFTNPTVSWVDIVPRDKNFQLDRAARKWLDDVVDIVMDTLDHSNFYAEMAQMFLDLPLFGTAVVIVYEDYEDKIRLYIPCAGEYFCKSGARFSVDSLPREFNLTVQQLVEMFGYEDCPEEVQKLWDQGGEGLDREYTVRCLIEPNYEISVPGRRGKKIRPVPGGFPFREIYWLRGIQGMKPLSKRGFHLKPFEVFRWAKSGNDPYGHGPCMEAIGDNKQVQWTQVRLDEYIEKGIRPPMGADVALKQEPKSTLPGQTTYMPTGSLREAKYFPLFEVQPAWVPPVTERIDKINARIERCLFVDVFMAITRMQGVQPRNELELTKRDLERLQSLGPVINLVENSLASVIMRVLDILQRRRQLPAKPPSLMGVPLKLAFETMLRRAQRAAKAMAMKGTVASLGQMSAIAKQAQVPDPVRKFNFDKAAEQMAIDDGWPIDCIFSDAEVQKHDRARMQAVQQAQMPGLAQAAVGAAKDLGQAQIGPSTALGALVGGGQPAPG